MVLHRLLQPVYRRSQNSPRHFPHRIRRPNTDIGVWIAPDELVERAVAILSDVIGDKDFGLGEGVVETEVATGAWVDDAEVEEGVGFGAGGAPEVFHPCLIGTGWGERGAEKVIGGLDGTGLVTESDLIVKAVRYDVHLLASDDAGSITAI